jgi:hypothetical protein
MTQVSWKIAATDRVEVGITVEGPVSSSDPPEAGVEAPGPDSEP